MTPPPRIKDVATACLAAVLLVCLVSPLPATRARMDTFSGLNDFIRDEENIAFYPSMISQYADLVVVNLGRVTGTGQDIKFPLSYRSAGAAVALGPAQKYGVAGGFVAQEAFSDTVTYLRGTTSGDPFSDLLRGWGPGDQPKELSHDFDLIYGYSPTERLTVGVRLHRGLFSSSTTSMVDSIGAGEAVTMDGEKRLDLMEIIGGLTCRWSSRTTIYLAAGPRRHDYLLKMQTPDERDEFRDVGHLSYSVRLKLERKLRAGIDLVGHLRYERIDLAGVGFHDGARDYNRDRRQETAGGGIALRYHREETFDLTGGVLVSRQRFDDRTDFVESTRLAPSEWQNVESTRTIEPQVFAAFEVNLNRWLILRLGVSQAVTEFEESTGEQIDEVVIGENRRDVTNTIRTNVGSRFLYKSLFVDFWLHSSAPYAPSAFIAGTGLTNPVLEVSTGYAF